MHSQVESVQKHALTVIILPSCTSYKGSTFVLQSTSVHNLWRIVLPSTKQEAKNLRNIQISIEDDLEEDENPVQIAKRRKVEPKVSSVS